MRAEPWRSSADERPPRVHEKIIECALCNHWAIAVKQNPYQVEQLLKNLERDKQKEVAGIIGSL
jgi:hypothetical protein